MARSPLAPRRRARWCWPSPWERWCFQLVAANHARRRGRLPRRGRGAGGRGAARRRGAAAPWWTERARLFVPERDCRSSGYLGSDARRPAAPPARLAAGRASAPATDEGAFEAAFSPVAHRRWDRERRFGNLSLRLYANGRHRPLALLGAGAAATQGLRSTSRSPDGARQALPMERPRPTSCPNGKVVAVEWHEVHFEPLPLPALRRARRSHAAGGGAPPVPAADAVVLQAGYIWERAAYLQGTRHRQSVTPRGERRTRRRLSIPAGVERLARARSSSARARRRAGAGCGSSRTTPRAGSVRRCSTAIREGPDDAPGFPGDQTRASDSIAAWRWALFALGFFALLLTEQPVGFVRDESVYFHAAEQPRPLVPAAA